MAAWVVTGVCWLLACALWFADQTFAAILLAAAGAAALVVGLVMHFRGSVPAGKSAAQVHRLGNAPHVSITCSAGNEFVQSLATTLSELREAAIESGWQVRWNEFEHLCRKADAASQAEDFPAAVQSYAKGISFMMHELRSQQNRKASDSGVDL